MKKIKYPLKFVGLLHFYKEISEKKSETIGECQINRAIFKSEDEIVIEFKDEPWVYTIKLNQVKDSNYDGIWEAKAPGGEDEGKVNCSVWWNEEGNRLLYGQWVENGVEFTWTAELEPVNHFGDESKVR